MEKFVVGATYKVNTVGNETITVISRSKCYVTFTGYSTGKKWIFCNEIPFKNTEFILVETGSKHCKAFCKASNMIECP